MRNTSQVVRILPFGKIRDYKITWPQKNPLVLHWLLYANQGRNTKLSTMVKGITKKIPEQLMQESRSFGSRLPWDSLPAIINHQLIIALRNCYLKYFAEQN